MNRKNLRLSLASLVVFLLVGVMCATAAFASFTNNTISSISSTNSAIHSGADIDVKLNDVIDPDKVIDSGKSYKSDDDVSLIVTLDGASLVDIWLANPQGYSTFSEYRQSVVGRNAAENLINKQNALFNKIKKSVNVTLSYNYVNVMNGFAIDIKYGDREKVDAITDRANVKRTVLATHYDAPEAAANAVENEVTAYDTGIFDSEKSIYENHIAGQGTVAAIIDTGLDWEHVAFNPNHPLFHLADQKKNNTLRYTIDSIKALVESKDSPLLADVRTRETKDGDVYTAEATAYDLYKNEKVVFAFDYADKDTEVSSDIDNSHGTHVAGIVAGHSDTPYKDETGKNYLLGKNGKYAEEYGTYAGKFYTQEKNGELKIQDNVVLVGSFDSQEAKDAKAAGKTPVVAVYDTKTKKQITGITGVAPQAQLVICKAFSDWDSGANSTSLYSALEDCMTLGVDTINMSLGSDSGFEEDTGAMDSVYEVYDAVGKSGISLVVAASNSMSSGYNSHYGLNLISNPDSATVGSPSTYDAAISVASISGVKSKYLSATNGLAETDPNFEEYGVAYYLDSAHVNGDAYDFMEDLFTAVRAKKLTQYIKTKTYTDENGQQQTYETLEIPYITILGVGDTTNYSGKDVKDKIALVQRGDLSFEDKIKIAQQKGALACIIFNNAAGIIRMQVGDDIKHDETDADGNKINFPACSITMDAAAPIRNKDVYATGGITPKFVFDPKAEAGPFMSDFTSWGPLPNLRLKPEITAHGGEIYSSIPGDETAYSRFSGTSMACPNMAGVVTLLRQYMKDPRFNNVEKFDLYQYVYDTDETTGKVKLDSEGNRVYKKDENGNKIRVKDAATNEDSTAIDLNVMEQRIYQILMSTATIARDEQDRPYSPRRQGAGLADLNRSESTEQYLYVKDSDGNETERAKLELLDDAKREGVYVMKFIAKNVGDKPVKYTISADVFTEGKSTDGKTVNEKAEWLTYDASLKINDQAADVNSEIEVPAKSETTIEYTVTLTSEAKAYLETFPNGMYVEGYVKLENIDKTDADKDGKQDLVNLNIPFLAFYGDWSDAPIMDYDIFETSADLADDNIDVDYKRYSGARELQMIGKLMEDGQEWALGIGQFAFNTPDGYDAPAAEEDKSSLSFNEANAMFNLYCVGGFLRGVKKMFYTITDVATGELIKEDVYYSARKAAGAGGIGGAWLDLDIADLNVTNNSQYMISIYPVIDWHAENYPSETTEERLASIDKIIEEGEAWNEAHATDGRAKRYSWSCKFWIDTDAPFISDTKVRVERDRSGEATYYIDFYLTDNHYISAMGLYRYNKDESRFTTAFASDGLRPLDTDRNTTTLVSYNITALWDQISEGLLLRMNNPTQEERDGSLGRNLTELQVILYDYAFNSSYYSIDLMDLLTAEYHTDVAFGDIANVTRYTANGRDPVDVFTSESRTIATDENGNYKTMDSITLIPGQKVNLKNAIISYPSTAWREELTFSVTPSDGSIIKFDEETYELYAMLQDDPAEGKDPLQRAQATLTIRSRLAGSKLEKSLTVNVLTNAEVKAYGIDTRSLQAAKTITGLSFEEGGKNFNAGESYVLEAEAEPWFVKFDPEAYFIRWESGSDLVATVAPLAKDDPEYLKDTTTGPMKARITANAAPRDENGNYIEGFDEEGKPLTDDNGNIKYVKYKKNNAFNVLVTATAYRVVTEEEYNNLREDRRFIDPITNRYGEKTVYTSSYGVNVLEEFVVSGNTLSEYHGVGGNVVIPDNLSITTIGDTLFSRNTSITSITFPEGVEVIGRASCAYMPNLVKVKFPSTLQTIGDYAFTADYTLADEGPNTKLSIIDTSACTVKPFKVGRYAFAMQRYVGTKTDQNVIIDKEDKLTSKKKQNKIFLLDEADAKLFDTSHLRLAAEYSLYGMRYVNNLDFSGLKSAGTAAFYEYGAGLSKYNLGVCSATFGENTFGGMGAFVAHGIKNLNLPMKRINNQMFVGNVDEHDNIIGDLESITFTADHLIIDEGAFAYSTVKNIKFEGDVVSIGAAAFYACGKLETVTFNGECEEIGIQSFANTHIAEITLPKGLRVLGAGAFANCDKLKTVNIAEGCLLVPDNFASEEAVATTEGAPFMESDNFTEFTTSAADGKVNDSLTVKNGALYSGDTLVCVPCGWTGGADHTFSTLLAGVKTIGAYAFGGANFYGATDIDLSTTDVENLEEGAFYSSNITSIKLNNKITKIGDAAFLDTPITKVDFGADSKVETIGMYAFYGNDQTGGKLKSIEIPESVSSLGICAFAYQIELESVVFKGNKIRKIEDGTFLLCQNLKEINSYRPENMNDPAGAVSKTEVPNCLYVDEVGVDAFVTADFDTFDLPLCTKIGDEAFAACMSLTEVNIPKVEEIGKYAFSVGINRDGTIATALTSVILSEGNAKPVLRTIGDEAFASQNLLKNIDLSTVETIGDSAFRASAVENIKSLDNVKSIGAYAFADTNVSITENDGAMVLPSTLTSIASTSFAGTKVSRFEIEKGEADNAYFTEDGVIYKTVKNGYELISYPANKPDLEYTIKDGTVRVAAYSFAQGDNLIRVNIPGSVKGIGDGAFYMSSAKVYNFLGLEAPELETSQQNFLTTYNDAYYWQVYCNFGMPFSYNLDGEAYKYNPIRQRDEYDIIEGDLVDENNNRFVGVNVSYTGGGFTDSKYDIMLCYPANATGFDTFIWSNYFDIAMTTPEAKEVATTNVENMIVNLPAANSVTRAHSSAITQARNAYNRLRNPQKAFIGDDLVKKLEDCEKALADLGDVVEATGASVNSAIGALPSADDITLDNASAIEAARKAYDSLTDGERANVGKDILDKLVACENKLNQLRKTNGNSGSNFGIGTMLLGATCGLAIAALVCLIVMLVMKKKAKKQANK